MSNDQSLSLGEMQRSQPWTVPYSGNFQRAAEYAPYLYATHAVLHAQKSLGKLAAVFENLDHRGRDVTSDDRDAVAAMSADLVTAAMRLANLYEFDLETVLRERVVEKNGVGFRGRQGTLPATGKFSCLESGSKVRSSVYAPNGETLSNAEIVCYLNESNGEINRLRACLRDWMADPRACCAVAKDCVNQDGCPCLYCRSYRASR